MKTNIFQVKEMIQYKISTNNIHIINSFQYTTRKEMKKIIQYLKELYPNNIVFKRPISSLIREWCSHNLLYKVKIARHRTKDLDLEYPQKWYYKITYFLLSLLYI